MDRWLAGEGSSLQHPAPKAGVLPIELPAKDRAIRLHGPAWHRPGPDHYPAPDVMGSLIKKRRKRMRKKKHKKMLKATRWQRRAAGK